MSDYIKRDFALDVVKRTSGDYAAAWAEIAHAPAADVAPVVHSTWIMKRRGNGWDDWMDITCPVCGFHDDKPSFIGRYCPACGAKMDG